MKIILLEKIVNLGNLGDIVEVKNGYARNYLIPSSKAKRASDANLKDFEARRSEYESAQKDILSNAQYRQTKIEAQQFSIMAKSGVDGKLFGSVTALDIAKAISATAGVEVNKHEVLLPNGPIKNIGEFDVNIMLHHDVQATVKVNVTAQA